jgi:hypothetical protein
VDADSVDLLEDYPNVSLLLSCLRMPVSLGYLIQRISALDVLSAGANPST